MVETIGGLGVESPWSGVLLMAGLASFGAVVKTVLSLLREEVEVVEFCVHVHVPVPNCSGDWD